MGVQDGITHASSSSAQMTEDTLQFFSLKKKQDQRVKGISFERFQELKQEGVFGDTYNIKDDKYLAALFLQ